MRHRRLLEAPYFAYTGIRISVYAAKKVFLAPEHLTRLRSYVIT